MMIRINIIIFCLLLSNLSFSQEMIYNSQPKLMHISNPSYFGLNSWNRSGLLYSTTEKELLAIALCLIEYQKLLYGGRITVYTNHENLTLKTLSIQQILRWRLLMDEFDLKLKYIQGKNNVLANRCL